MIRFEHLDVNVVDHCNNHCTSCTHCSPFSEPSFMPPETLAADLRKLREVAHFDYICLLGGEPLLHPELDQLVRVTKASGAGDQARVVTNGWLLPQMREEFWRAMWEQAIEWTVYPNIPADVESESDRVMETKCPLFHITPFKNRRAEFSYCFDAPDDGTRFRQCYWKGSCMTVHYGHLFLCAQSRVFPHRWLGKEQGHDGLPLDGITEESLQAFLDRTEPLSSCSICAGSFAKTHPHEQCASEEEWKKRSTAI